MTDLDPAALDKLTTRQRECLRATIRTGSAGSAARALGLSPNTVQDHLARAQRRSGIETIQAAYLLGVVHGLRQGRKERE